jgi:alpha-1,2-glucosyltransferase
VATIHLAQMLYIWPFFAFFSWPLCLPSVLSTLGSVIEVLLGQDARSTPSSSYNFDLGTFLRLIIWLGYALATVIGSIAIVKYNTIIHPFTLADNRHYMFYVFRYTIRRAEWIRYALVLPYTASRWLVWATFGGYDGNFFRADSSKGSIREQGPFNNYPVWNTSKPATRSPQTQEKAHSNILLQKTEPVSTSTGLIFLLATALSLVTAPLVEPRYFIIPWLMWRLLLPAWPSQAPVSQGRDAKPRSSAGGGVGKLFQQLASQRVALSMETAWFMAVNVVTGYMFLTRPYQWRATDGTLLDDGRWQRFMW